jgi:quercetin dioxygenase-like cupin family protein
MMDYRIAPEQPYGVEIKMADGIFVKQMAVPKAGTIIPQHSHKYEHLSMLARGSVHVLRDGEDAGLFYAPTGITIPAGCKHTFRTLEDNTVIYCIHNIKDAESVEIAEEHHLFGVS